MGPEQPSDCQLGRRASDSLSLIAHEMRAPLSALATASELLIHDIHTLEPQQVRDMLTTIRQGAYWLQGLVENLLCAATMQAGALKLRIEAIDLLDVLMDVQPLVEPLLLQKGQRLRVMANGAVPQVAADRRWIGHVLMNLIANASKYSGVGKPVSVRFATADRRVRVSVADRGAGLPAGAGHRLFEPYYRGPDAAASDRGGMGLGLAIVKAIVEAHGGSVGAGKRSRGGARVWFDLPCAPGVDRAVPGLYG